MNNVPNDKAPKDKTPNGKTPNGQAPNDQKSPTLSLCEVFEVGLWTALVSLLVLFFGGLAYRVYFLLRPGPTTTLDCAVGCDWVKSLLVFSVCGAIVAGTILFAWRLVHRKRSAPGWGLGVVALVVVLFGLLVWPTPWTYREYGCDVLQINRFVGTKVGIARLPCDTTGSDAGPSPTSPKPPAN